MANSRKLTKAQSSLELLITVSFGLIILLPIVVIAFIQVSTSTSNIAVSEAQAVAAKLAAVAANVGSQGYPAKQLVLIQVPPDVAEIDVGTPTNSIGHAITFVVDTNAGPSDAVAYTPVNVSGAMANAINQGTYLINVSAQTACPSAASYPCVYITTT
jgi:hypothetical protein